MRGFFPFTSFEGQNDTDWKLDVTFSQMLHADAAPR